MPKEKITSCQQALQVNEQVSELIDELVRYQDALKNGGLNGLMWAGLSKTAQRIYHRAISMRNWENE